MWGWSGIALSDADLWSGHCFALKGGLQTTKIELHETGTITRVTAKGKQGRGEEHKGYRWWSEVTSKTKTR